MYSRPGINDDEDEVLKLQEEFYKNLAANCVNPAAKLVKLDNLDKKDEPKDDNNQMESVPNVATVPEFVMGNIVEKNDPEQRPKVYSFPKSKSGFPQATRRLPNTGSTKRRSIFAQQMTKDNTSGEINKNIPSGSQYKLENRRNEPKSYIISGPESGIIHKENQALLNQMDPAEILREKQKLLSTMDPKLLQFIASKRQEQKAVKVSCGNDIHPSAPMKKMFKSSDETASTSKNSDHKICIENLEELPIIPEVFADPSSKNWLHFDNLETDKLEWMKSLKKPDPPKDGEAYEARFDFAGWLQPFSEEASDISEKTRILYHHGEEAGRPGYTIRELINLCRSTVLQQRVLALNTIANILALNSIGFYDDIIDVPIEQIFFVIRFALDDNAIPVTTASLRALCNMFYYQVDEMCLDTLLTFNCGLMQPILEYEKIELNDDANKTAKEQELNDQQMAETDLIQCLLRTDILIRLRYILTTLHPPPEAIAICFDLLTRILRDSQRSFTEVFNCEYLITTIISDYMPTTPSFISNSSDRQTILMVIKAVKLMRITASRSKHATYTMIDKCSLLEPLFFYLSEDASNTDLVKLQTEVLFLFATLIHYSGLNDKLRPIEAVLLRILNYHVRATNVSEDSVLAIQGHVTSVLCVATQIAKTGTYSMIEPFIKLLNDGFLKWSTQTAALQSFKCGSLRIISALYRCWAEIQTVNCPSNPVVSVLNSAAFVLIAKNAVYGSNLLCTHKPHVTGSALDSVQASIWEAEEHIVPILQSNGSFPFLSSLSSFLRAKCPPEVILLFLRSPNIHKYFKKLNTTPVYNLTSNWFTRIESEFIMNCLQMAILVSDSLNEMEKYIIYCIAMKCIFLFTPVYRNDIGNLLRNVIFNRNFFPTETMLLNLHISDENNVFSSSILKLNEIRDCYMNSFGLQKVDLLSLPNLSLKNHQDGMLPSDWVYLPIIALYANYDRARDRSSASTIDMITVISSCLRWVVVFESLFPKLAQMIDVTDRYCRLSCVFLCSNTIFLENEISSLLEMCLKLLLHNKTARNCLNFDKDIKGLTSFQDFYTLLLEQYQGVSYGDAVFGNFIMVPLGQQHNVKWKKVLWSEYAGVTQILSLKENQLLLPIEEFLIPHETNVSVLQCYKRSLTFGHLSRSPLLAKISQYHIEEYMKKKRT